MEILILTIGVLTLLLVGVLVVTRGHPSRIFPIAGRTVRLLGQNRWSIFFVILTMGLAAGFVYLVYVYPSAAMGPRQPIDFSHRVHAGIKDIDCRFCHPYVDRSTYPGVPEVEKCLFCHDHIIASHPEIQKEHQYFDTSTPTPWQRVNYLPEHVMFNHQRHIKKDVACASCHGQVERQDRLKGRAFKMGFCLECHRAEEANLDCWLACHK